MVAVTDTSDASALVRAIQRTALEAAVNARVPLITHAVLLASLAGHKFPANRITQAFCTVSPIIAGVALACQCGSAIDG